MIYLDNAATSFPKPEGVYPALDRFARTTLANPGRAGHKMALAAEHALDDARHRLNQFFHGKSPERFVFTLNCTDALNMAFKGVLNDGDHVITTDLEHNSVSRPLVALAEAGNDHADARRGRRRRHRRSATRLRRIHAEDATHRPDARQQRARHRAADRRDRRSRLARATRCSSWTRPRRPA